MRIKILRTFNGNVLGESWKFTEGETREVPDAPALEFIRGGYAQRIDQPAIKILGGKSKTDRKASIK